MATAWSAALKDLGGDTGGFADADRLTHSLQTATRPLRDGRDEEFVVCALVHDIGDLMGPANHAEIGAAMMKPYVSEANHWMMDKHGVFQGYYFFHLIGLDREMREQYRALHPHFEALLRNSAICTTSRASIPTMTPRRWRCSSRCSAG